MEADNLYTQAELTEETLVDTLEARYNSGQIYTNSGLMLLSINPYAELDVYSPAVAEMYRRRVDNLRPHIFSLLDSCLEAAPAFGVHSILISGESGSGKTETARRMLTYLGIPLFGSVEVILEALGNAWTINNDNSSRFGKLIRLDGAISVEAFLLEKGRVTSSAGERNFHIFYYLLANAKRILANDFIDNAFHSDECRRLRDKKAYDAVVHAFSDLGLDFQPVESILWGILNMGSVRIVDNTIVHDDAFSAAATGLCIPEAVLEEYLLTKKIQIKDDCIVKNYTDEESIVLRDSVCRILYDQLFAIVTGKINQSLKKTPTAVRNLNILDIFGLENMPVNGLDQFCINWCNEKIYDEFVKNTFEAQKTMLEEEGVLDEPVGDCQMHRSCIPLIEGRCGVAALIAEESLLNGTAESLSIKMEKILGLKAKASCTLEIEHFAGRMVYDLTDFLRKNRESGDLKALYSDRSMLEANELLSMAVANSLTSNNVVKTFQRNLRALFELLSKTTLKYVKCLKPNLEKAPMAFDRQVIQSQLRANGILQAVELSRVLYPYSLFIDDFEERYAEDERCGIVPIKGQTKYFFNNRAFNVLEEAKKNGEARRTALVIYVCRENIRIIKDELTERMETERRVLEESAKETATPDDRAVDTQIEVGADSQIVDILEGTGALSEMLNGEVDEASCTNTECVGQAALTVVSEDSAQREDLPMPTAQSAEWIDQHFECQLKIRRLEAELAKYRKFSVSCSNCQVLGQKYKIQSQQLLMKQFVEVELEKVKARLRTYEDSEESSLENASAYNIFGCLIQLYLDYCPVYSGKDIPSDEMLSLAHAILFAIDVFPASARQVNLGICLDEVNKRLAEFEENISMVAFILSNLIELRTIVCRDQVPDTSQLDATIGILFSHLCQLQRRSLDDLLPASVLDYQHLKEFRVRESIYKKIFAGPTVLKLIDHLEYFYNLDAYFCLPDVIIINNLSYLLSYIDFVSFNALLAKRKFLNANRCIQINYNLSEIERFCFNVSFHHGFYNMAYMREAARLALAVSTGSKSPALGPATPGAPETDGTDSAFARKFSTIDGDGRPCRFSISNTESINDLLETSLLNAAQISTIINLFEAPPIKISCTDSKSLKKFIDEPKPIVPTLACLQSNIKFVKPKYLPDKSIKSILRTLKEQR